MSSKNLVFTIALCISFFLVTGESLGTGKSYTDENNEEPYLLNEGTLNAEDSEERSVQRDTETDSEIHISNNLRKALERLQKLQLELAIEATRLEELNKLREAEKINENTPSYKLSKWQKKILNGIIKTIRNIKELTKRVEVSETLAQKLTTEGDELSAIDETQIKEKTKKIVKALEEQNKINLELAIATTKLEELNKQKEAEKVDVLAATNKLTKWQKDLLSDISKAREKKGDLSVKAAIIKTKINELKQQLTAAGGSSVSISLTSSKNEQEINEKINKAENSQLKINSKLALITTELEQLQKRKEAGNIDPHSTNLTKQQKKLLNDIEKAKYKKYHLTVEAVIGKTLIEQLKQQLNSSEESPSS